jgi:hypothetical protein
MSVHETKDVKDVKHETFDDVEVAGDGDGKLKSAYEDGVIVLTPEEMEIEKKYFVLCQYIMA